jgi:hypothetical protein
MIRAALLRIGIAVVHPGKMWHETVAFKQSLQDRVVSVNSLPRTGIQSDKCVVDVLPEGVHEGGE